MKHQILEFLEKFPKIEIDFSYDGDGAPNFFEHEKFKVKLGVKDYNKIWAELKIYTEDMDFIDDRFEYFEALENILWTCYQEFQNNDPCSFTYQMDTNHLGDHLILTVICTDYFS